MTSPLSVRVGSGLQSPNATADSLAIVPDVVDIFKENPDLFSDPNFEFSFWNKEVMQGTFLLPHPPTHFSACFSAFFSCFFAILWFSCPCFFPTSSLFSLRSTGPLPLASRTL